MIKSLDSWILLGSYVTRIAVWGDICIDKYTLQNKKILGGCAFNVAYHLKSLGKEFVFFAPIGNDHYSRIIESKLDALEIEYELNRLNFSNQTIEVILDCDNDRSFKNFEGSILEHLYCPDFSSFEIVICPYFREIRPLVDLALKEYGKIFALDLSDAQEISEEDLRQLSLKTKYINISGEKFSHELLLELSSECIITVTLGSFGSRIYKDLRFTQSERPIQIKVEDATGAGDSFFSYICAKLGSDIGDFELVTQASAYTYATLLRLGSSPIKI